MKAARFLPLVAAGALVLSCHEHEHAEGPIERAGKHVDHAAVKTGDALHRAAQKTDAVAHKAVSATGAAFEKAGQKLKGSPSATPASSSAHAK